MEIVGDLATNLLAAFIGGAAVWLGRVYALPVLRGRLRQLPKLNGTNWRRVSDEFDSGGSVLSIRQSGTKLTATITRNEQRQRIFRYSGQISGHQIVLTWEDSDSPEQMIGAMVLYLAADLTRLRGYSTYFRHSTGKVVAIERTYKRMTGA